MDIFKLLADKNLCKQTKYVYFADNAGCSIYKFNTAQERNIILEMFKSKGIIVQRIKQDKIYLMFFDNYFCGACY